MCFLQISHSPTPTATTARTMRAGRVFLLCLTLFLCMAERRDNKGVLKKQLKDQCEKLDDLDTRLSRVEAIQERQEGYRRLRVEQCAGLDTLWNSVESKEVPAAELRSRTASVLEHNVFRRHLKRRLRKTSCRPKYRSCRGKRAVPTAGAARGALADRVALRDLVEWVKKERSGAFNIILVAGEPSRLLYEVIRKEVNWFLYVMGKLAGADGCLQIYPDRGPIQRKGKGKGKGKAKGKGKQKGKAAGKQDVDA